jgi:hypothetical protein
VLPLVRDSPLAVLRLLEEEQVEEEQQEEDVQERLN